MLGEKRPAPAHEEQGFQAYIPQHHQYQPQPMVPRDPFQEQHGLVEPNQLQSPYMNPYALQTQQGPSQPPPPPPPPPPPTQPQLQPYSQPQAQPQYPHQQYQQYPIQHHQVSASHSTQQLQAAGYTLTHPPLALQQQQMQLHLQQQHQQMQHQHHQQVSFVGGCCVLC